MNPEYRLPKAGKNFFDRNPVIDQTRGKATEISLIPYFKTRRFVARKLGEPMPIGYCKEPPREVLETAFKDYHITRYNGYELFSSSDFQPTTPMIGLGIAPIDLLNIDEIEDIQRLEKLLQFNELLRAKRDKPISSQDIQRIIAHLSKELEWGFMDPDNGQHRYNKQEIIEIVSTFR